MRLTRLRLLGFKSFVEATDFQIEPGLTGVVGPNGCGKSNLVEALRWVMGETSHKSMRAADMDDIIFSGNASRPGRNNAEVSLRIDNRERQAPAQFNGEDALDVARRIERDQGSTYRVNGREVRARDVQLLFADASTGARSPALVHQGRIGEIIQAKPQQRRRVLEDAAGIAGLHARRHEAELRLRAAEQNLARLEDVIGQLAGQIDGLKRQSRQAVRYKALSQQVRKAEATLYHLRHVGAAAEVAASDLARDLALRVVAERTAAQAFATTQQTLAAAALAPLRDAEASAGAIYQRLILAREALDREEARARARIAELDRHLAQLTEDIGREKRLSGDAEAALARLAAEHDALSREAAASAGQRDEVEARVAAADAALAGSERIFGELTGALADLCARRNQLDGARREHGERAAKLAAELAEIAAERARVEAAAQADIGLAALAASVAAANAAVAEAEAAALRSEAAHSASRQALDVARQPLATADRRAQRLETEAKTLAKVLHVDAKHLWPPVIDLLSVDKGYETALGAALGDDLDAPIEANAPMRWAGAPAEAGDPALPVGAEALAAHVNAPGELARRLAQIGVVERAEGARLAAVLRPGQRLVSREGDLWRWDGFAVAAHSPTGAARRLAERNRLADVEAELTGAREEAEARRLVVTAAERDAAFAGEAESTCRARWRDLQRDANDARDRHAQAEREVAHLTARRSALAEAQARIESGLTDATAAAAAASVELERLPPADRLEADLAAVRLRVGSERASLAESRAQAQGLAREVEMAARRLTGIADESRGWSDRHDGAAAQIATLTTRVDAAASERAALNDAPQAFANQRAALIEEIDAAEGARRMAADALASAETALADADRAARAALEAQSSAREDAARAEERCAGARRRLDDIAREIRDMLEIEPGELAVVAALAPGAVAPSVTEVEATLDKLRRERERLGAVNLRAEEELREVEAQHTTLTAERDDLVEAIKRLRQGIQSLNREARERLLASFAQVNTHFKELFAKLFGGGTAELHLIENDDPLEAGLEIIAKPPGKKPATLSLLSGGEQALTALALIFAVFLTNPAPVCVLDEVDAPLDDHNIERFCDLLDEMTKSTDTRFLIITHNPITMARMNRLFGVTMAERGVSQLVSVDLEDAVRLREAG
ncbi:MAG: chromosome segregation protein SMC [Proteobacteria bacterium]|nr:chromosome segregation protein SMC [Pseudomonadota bacterium]